LPSFAGVNSCGRVRRSRAVEDDGIQ